MISSESVTQVQFSHCDVFCTTYQCVTHSLSDKSFFLSPRQVYGLLPISLHYHFMHQCIKSKPWVSTIFKVYLFLISVDHWPGILTANYKLLWLKKAIFSRY